MSHIDAKNITFCHCGRQLEPFNRMIESKVKYCKIHGFEWKIKPVSKKIGKYSGKSKTPYGKYEER